MKNNEICFPPDLSCYFVYHAIHLKILSLYFTKKIHFVVQCLAPDVNIYFFHNKNRYLVLNNIGYLVLYCEKYITSGAYDA